MKFEVGKRVWVLPLKMWATIHTIYYLPKSEWDNPEEPLVGNIKLKYDDGIFGESNNWQLSEVER